MKNTVYLAIGGSEEAMRKRCEKLIEKRREKSVDNEENSIVIVSGFLSEIEFMEKFFVGEFNYFAYSYDTLSNIQRCKNNLMRSDEVWIATSPLHWKRIQIILKKFPQIEKKVNWLKTDEPEASYAKLGLLIYKFFGPTLLQKIAVIMRWKRYHREYRAPINERKWCAFFGVYY